MRRELLWAFEHGKLIVPVLEDDMRIDVAKLPRELDYLGELQQFSIRIEHGEFWAGIGRLADQLSLVGPRQRVEGELWRNSRGRFEA